MNISRETKCRIDELVMYAKHDPQLQESIKWLDLTNKFPNDMDFYERVIICLAKYEADEKAKKWSVDKMEKQ